MFELAEILRAMLQGLPGVQVCIHIMVLLMRVANKYKLSSRSLIAAQVGETTVNHQHNQKIWDKQTQADS